MEFDFSKTYYKIMNKEENHNGYQYHDGLNVDPNKWSTKECSAGGFYFTDIKNILEWIDYSYIIGYYVREVTVPEDALVSIEKNKFKANKIILGKRMKLLDLDTIKYLVEHGADIVKYRVNLLYNASSLGHLDIVKYLVELGVNIRVNHDYALQLASQHGHLDIVKYLVEQGADIHADDNLAFRWARKNKQRAVVKYLKSLR